MSEHAARVLIAVAVALASASAPASAQTGWAVEVAIAEGPLTTADATPVLEEELAAVAECAPGAGPFRLVYSVSVGSSGGVRSATPDRAASGELAPARAVRCARHVLEELTLPERGEASRLVVTFRLGGTPAGPGETPATGAPPGRSPPVSTPMPAVPSEPPSGGGTARVEIGALATVDGRAAGPLRAVLEAGRPALLECYVAALGAAPDLSGAGILHLTIAPDGHVTRALFAGGEAMASAMALCLGSAARRLAFAAAEEEARLDVPLDFTAP